MRLLLILFLLWIPFSLSSQESLEMLENRMNEAQGEEQLKLMITLGNIYATTDPERGLELGLKAAFISKRINNPIYEGQALLLMGLSSLNAGQHENSIRYYNRALNHFEKINMRQEQIAALEGIAEIYNQARNFELATQYLRRALVIAQELTDIELQVEIHQLLGDIAINQNNFSVAYREYSNVNKLLGDESQLESKGLLKKLRAYRQIGFVYRNLGQFDESLLSYRKASNIGKRFEDKSSEVRDLQEIAFSHYLLQQFDSASIYYNQALSFYQLQNDTLSLVDVLIAIGDVFFEKEQFRQAVASYNRGLEFAQRVGNVQAQVSALVNISRCFNAFGDYPSSKDYLTLALNIATRENLTNSAADVYRYLSQIYEEEGRFVQALEYYKLWAELRDSIYSEESGQKLARLQILYDITQKERENEILRQNTEIQSLLLTKTQYQRMVFIALALFLFALLVLFYFYFRVKEREFKKQKETEQRIIELNKNLERRMISEIKKQEKQQLLLAQKSKLESLGTLAAGIAHEVNQPLGGISMGLDNILFKLSEDNLTDEYLKEKVGVMFENVERIKRIIDHTRTFSRSHKPASFERIDVNEVVKSSLSMVESQFAGHNIKLDVSLSPQLVKVIADRFKLEQVILNLLSNAKYAVDEKYKNDNYDAYEKQIHIATWQDEDTVNITVTDNGIGINKSDLEKIFDPFYTTKKVDKGTGLGLSISYGFIKDLLGDIVVDSEEGVYTKFDVKIPKS